MIRRSRISVRPNVRPGVAPRTGTLATPQDCPSQSHAAVEAPSAVTEPNATASAVTIQTPGDTPDQSSEGTMTSSAVQRRKRFSIKPKVTPTLTRTSNRTPKSPLKTVSESPVKAPCSGIAEQTESYNVESTVSQSLPSASQQSSEDSSLLGVPLPYPTALPTAGKPLEVAQQSPETHPNTHCLPVSQAKVVPPKAPDKGTPSLPDKEAMEISERAKTLVSRSSKTKQSSASKRVSLSQLLNDQSDLQRLAKANKLRELLRQEMHKEKAKCKKAKARAKEYTLDHTKMTMKDLIYYLPISNPMSGEVEEAMQENETVVPPSPATEEQPENAEEPEIPPETTHQTQDDDDDEGTGEEEDDALMVPRVKVAEDGTLIIDEESLTVQVKRAKGTNPAQDRDPIFERGSTTTYSSFRKGTHTKPWSTEETEMFFLAISMVGTDFSMICQLFPHRARSEIKNKFKREERENAWRIDKAFKERRKLDLEFFTKLLEKILEVQNNKKLTRSCSEKKATRKTKKHNRKSKENLPSEEDEVEKAASVVEDEDVGKENAEGTSASPKKKCRKNNNRDLSNDNAKEKAIIGNENGDNQGEACVPEDAEAALPEEDRSAVEGAETPECVKPANETRIKPAQLSRGRAPKPLVPVGRRLGKKAPAPATKPKIDAGATDATEKSLDEVPSEEQVVREDSPSRQAKTQERVDKDTFSEDEDSTVKPSKPTRYGRTPKPVEHLNYPAKEDVHSPASAALPQARKAKSSAKTKSKHPDSRKAQLVTLRASQTESSDEEADGLGEVEEMEEQAMLQGCHKDSSAPVFVPASLRSPQPVVSEVEETMEELDIMANVPDVLGVSQDVLCPDASDESGMASCEHQLDLLADVIDFLSGDNMEVSEKESYTEAAQTLLTIGSLTHLSPSAQLCKDTTGSPSCDENIMLEPVDSSGTPQMAPDLTVTDTSMIDIMEQDKSTNHPVPQAADIADNKEVTVTDTQSARQIEACSDAPVQCTPLTRRGRVPKLKPKPNLGLSTRTRTQTAPSPPKTPEESLMAPRELPAGSGPPSVAERSHSGSVLAPGADFTLPREPSASREESGLLLASLRGESGTVSTQHSAPSDTHCLSQTNHTHVDQANTQSTADTMVSPTKPAEDTTTASMTLSIDSQGQGSSALPSSPVQKDSKPSTFQAAKSRFCKVKPKPNLGQSKLGSRDSRVAPMERSKSPASNPEIEPHPTGHTVADMEQQNTGHTVAEMEPHSTGHTVAEIEPHPTGHTVAEIEPHPTGHTVAEIEPHPTGHTVAEIEPHPTGHRVAEIEPHPTGHRVAEIEPHPTGHRVAEIEPHPTGHTVAEIEPHPTGHRVAEIEQQATYSGARPEKPPADPCSSFVSVVPVEMCAPETPMEESSPCEETRTGVGAGPHVGTSSDSLPKNATLKRRGRLPKARPNIASSVRSKPAKSPEQPVRDESKISDHVLGCSDTPSEQQAIKDSQTLSEVKPVFDRCDTSLHCSKEEHCVSGNSGAPDPEAGFKNNSNIADVIITSDTVLYEHPFVIVDSGVSQMSRMCVSPALGSSAGRQKAQADSELLIGCDLSLSTGTREVYLRPTQDVPPISELKSSGKCPKSKPKIVPSDLVSYPAETDGSAQQACSEHSRLKSRAAPQEDLSENVEANRDTTARPQDALNIDTQTKPPDSGQFSRKARRARLPKPKPNLGSRNHPINPPPDQRTADPEQVFSSCLEAPEKQASPGHESEPSSVILQPVDGATSPHISVANTSYDAVSDLPCMTQMPVTIQGDASPVVGGSKSLPFLATNPDDSEEPYFILSLTEIPVFPQEGDSTTETLPYLPTAAPPVQFQSLNTPTSVHQTASAEGPASLLDSAEMDQACVQGMEGALTQTPVTNTAMDLHEDAIIQPPVEADVVGDCEEVEPPYKKRRVAETCRRAKVQVKPNTAGKRQPGKTHTAKEAELSSVDKQHPTPSLGQESVGTAEREVLTEPEAAVAHLEAEKSTSTEGANSTPKRPGRKPKGFLSFLSDKSTSTSPQTRASAPRPQVKPSSSGRKRAAPKLSTSIAPSEVTSDSASAADILSATAALEQAGVTIAQTVAICPTVASTSQFPTEAPVTLHDSPADEPMNVSQYFLSDIFTNVDEG